MRPGHVSSIVPFETQLNLEKHVKLTQFSLLKENGSPAFTWLVADFPHMNVTQMHERLRLEMLRRIQRGTASISLLSRQTGLGKSHLSNFLHSRRRLSLEGIDRMLSAQHMAADDLLQLASISISGKDSAEPTAVPVISHSSALFEPVIRPSAVQMMLHLPPEAVHAMRARTVAARRIWQRFVAIRIAHSDALPMDPLLLPDALAVIDRHYNSLIPYRAGRPNLYAVRNGAHLTLRYADFDANRLILRPLSMAYPVDLIDIGTEASPGEFIAGRVVLTINVV